jgi:hypothetical protein
MSNGKYSMFIFSLSHSTWAHGPGLRGLFFPLKELTEENPPRTKTLSHKAGKISVLSVYSVYFHEKACQWIIRFTNFHFFCSNRPTSLSRHASIRTLEWGCHWPRCMLISVGRGCYLSGALTFCWWQPTGAEHGSQSPG